jgi:hypothetical protein
VLIGPKKNTKKPIGNCYYKHRNRNGCCHAAATAIIVMAIADAKLSHDINYEFYIKTHGLKLIIFYKYRTLI